MQLNFDATQHDPSQSVSVCLPLADYPFTIVSADVESVKDKQNEGLLKVGLRIDDGPYRGAVQIDRFNIYNSNPQAVQIAYKELSALCHVTNRLRLATEKDLIGGQGLATIGPQTNNDKYSEVKQYKYTNGALPGANGQQQQQPQQQPQQQQQPTPAFNQPQQPAQQTTQPPAFDGGQPAFQPQQPAQGGFQPQQQPQQPQGGFQPQGGGFQQQPAPGGNLPPWAK